MDRQPRQVEFLMGTYSYSVARFVPDPIKNEPVNIGAIVVDQETGRTAHRFLRSMRGLAQRCPGADLGSLEKMIGSIQVEDMPGGAADLEDLARGHTNLLQFTPPRAVVASTLEESLQRAFKTYIGNDAAQARSGRLKSPREILVDEIDTALSNDGIFGVAAVAKRQVFAGRRGRFIPDRSISSPGWIFTLHAISFRAKARSKIASVLRDAKAFAVDFEDAKAKNEGLECTVLVEPADGDGGGTESHAQASGHLEDKDCKVIGRSGIGPCARQLGRRLGLFDQAGRPLLRSA